MISRIYDPDNQMYANRYPFQPSNYCLITSSTEDLMIVWVTPPYLFANWHD